MALQFPDNAGGEALRAALERHGLLAAALQRLGRPCAFRRIVARPRRLHWALLPFARADRDLAAAPRGGAPSGFAAAPPPPGERARFHALALNFEVGPCAPPLLLFSLPLTLLYSPSPARPRPSHVPLRIPLPHQRARAAEDSLRRASTLPWPPAS